MLTSSCIPLIFPSLAIVETVMTDEEVFIAVQSTEASATCSKCGMVSIRHHSSYLRHVQDTPIGLFIVWLRIKVRRFRCDNPNCKQQTFAEQYPDLVVRRRRRTSRLLLQLAHIGLALGGSAGARLAKKLMMFASASTVLRLLHQMEAPSIAEPRIIGIDDWAFRKGRDYGTIIIDHETGKPIDLLPKRDSQTVEKWLAKHPTIEIVTRDRSGEYREAIAQALPNAVQIADRWHLLKNLGDAIQRHISRRYNAVRQLVVASTGENDSDQVDSSITEKYRRYNRGSGQETLHAARTEEREALFAAVKARQAQGVYTTDLAKEFNLSRQTISHWVNSETCPPDTRGRFKRKCLIDAYVPYLRQRIEAGCQNKSQLWREIEKQGFTGTRTLVGKWIRQNYNTKDQSAEKLPSKKTGVAVPSSRELAWLIIRRTDELEEDKKQIADILLQDAQLAEFKQMAHKFMYMVRNGSSEQWSSWLTSSCESTVKELKNFAIGLKRDGSAVYEAIRQPWSNGRTEGHVNRLKFIKRQMYGRASFDLLRLRVLLAG